MLIPTRPNNAVRGSEFISSNMKVNRAVRETNFISELENGNIPSFLRNFKPIEITIGVNTITYMCMSDYLSIGSDEDFFRVASMNVISGQKIADLYDCTLPTRKMVNDIWYKSQIKLEPLPWGPPYNEEMLSTYRMKIHNDRIQAQLKNSDITQLISGHKKDMVLSNYLAPNNPKKRVAIYGWIKQNGIPIQNLNYFDHELPYSDYSQSVRLIANDVMVNGSHMRIQDVFKDKTLSKLISDEGPLNFLRY
jgi:hypothetical protein